MASRVNGAPERSDQIGTVASDSCFGWLWLAYNIYSISPKLAQTFFFSLPSQLQPSFSVIAPSFPPHHLPLMSRSSRNSTINLAPPHDIVMGPPPLPSQLTLTPSQSSTLKLKDSPEVGEKYKRLKRKYFELEQVSFHRVFFSHPHRDPNQPSMLPEIERHNRRAQKLRRKKRQMEK